MNVQKTRFTSMQRYKQSAHIPKRLKLSSATVETIVALVSTEQKFPKATDIIKHIVVLSRQATTDNAEVLESADKLKCIACMNK